MRFLKHTKRPFQLTIWIAMLLSLILVSTVHGGPANASPSDSSSRPIRIGSKMFAESYVLAEMYATLLENRGYRVERKFGLGGTMICHGAIENGDIDVYVEYTGTMDRVILGNRGKQMGFARLQEEVRKKSDLQFLSPLGFNNTYALALRDDFARKHNLKRISDLTRIQNHPESSTEVRYGFNPEFLEREDGAPMLRDIYGLALQPAVMNHALLYRAITNKRIDVLNAFSTDAEVLRYNLVLLEDDRKGFPAYMAAPLVRQDLDPLIKKILNSLAGRLDDETMRRINLSVSKDNQNNRLSFRQAARDFLQKENLLNGVSGPSGQANTMTTGSQTGSFVELVREILYLSIIHISLTAIAVLGAVLFAVPFAIVIYRLPGIAGPILYTAGLFQTIPSIALLALMIPLFGIGTLPAVVALFVYALLPVLRNTHAALQSIDPVLKNVSVAMGLSPLQRLRYVEIPLALPGIMAGIRTAAIINIGTATLAAFIGAGGLGEPIVTGLSLNDTSLILKGAIPAAILAILVELLFELLERWLFPAHIRQN